MAQVFAPFRGKWMPGPFFLCLNPVAWRCEVLTKDQIKDRLDSHSSILKAIVEALINKGVIDDHQLRETVIIRGLYWRNKAVRDALKQLNTTKHSPPQ